MHATPPLPPAERGTRLLAASIDELILLALCLPMVFGAVTALLPLASTDPSSPMNAPMLCSKTRRRCSAP